MTTGSLADQPDRLVAGVDLGGTKIAACIADQTGVLTRMREAVPLAGDERTVARAMIALIRQCCDRASVDPQHLAAVGVSACGPFVGRAGERSSAAPNLCGGLAAGSGLPNHWTRVEIEAPLREHFARLVLANDAQAALLAEHRFGALRGTDDCAYVTWSTGIGVGLMLGGQLLRGKAGNAGHAGHSVIAGRSADGTRCGCGNPDDIEALAGGAALSRRWGEDAATLFSAYRAGDQRARDLVDAAIDAVADLLYNLVVTLDLGRIALGGGLFCAQADVLLPALRTRLLGAGRRPGMHSMLEGVTITAVVDSSMTAELGALALVAPSAWQSGFEHYSGTAA